MLKWLLSLLPILCLLACLLALKMPARKASAWSFLATSAIYFFLFKSGSGIMISMAKGFGLAVFVVLIIWGAILLYNVVKEVGALDVINENIERSIEDKLIQFLFLSWVFASFLQGIAGFGVPVIVVTPILIGLGFAPEIAAAGVLIGHSWSISFGSMGSSIYAINMVTKARIEDIVLNMSIFGTLAMVCTGFAVCIVFGKKETILRGFIYVLITSVFMGTTLYVMAKLQMFSIIGLAAGTVGSGILLIISKICQRKKKKLPTNATCSQNKRIGLGYSVLPYLLIVVLSIFFFFIDPQFKISFDFPGYETLMGRIIEPETEYVKLNVLKFPLSIILISTIISAIIFTKKKALTKEKLKIIFRSTVRSCIPTTLTIVFLLVMAVLMMDSGMIENLAVATIALSGKTYPIFSPFVGLLGAFITGSNTNSNIIFGNFQEIAANTLGYNATIMCATQSIGATLGGAIGPTTIALGATAGRIQGKESLIYQKTLIPILVSTALIGLLNYIVIH
jgi:lactate permease